MDGFITATWAAVIGAGTVIVGTPRLTPVDALSSPWIRRPMRRQKTVSALACAPYRMARPAFWSAPVSSVVATVA